MEVLLLTTLFSVVFAVFFLTLFIRDRQTRRFGGVEREALLPFDDGDPAPRDPKSETSPSDSENTKKPDISLEKTGV